MYVCTRSLSNVMRMIYYFKLLIDFIDILMLSPSKYAPCGNICTIPNEFFILGNNSGSFVPLSCSKHVLYRSDDLLTAVLFMEIKESQGVFNSIPGNLRPKPPKSPYVPFEHPLLDVDR